MRAIALLCLVACSLFGCGKSGEVPVPVSGKVTMGGKPIDGASVSFLRKDGAGQSASGKTDKDGNFKLSCLKTDDGAPPGEFVVTISKTEAKGGGSDDVDISKGYSESYGKMMGAAGSGKMSSLTKETLPAKYADPASKTKV